MLGNDDAEGKDSPLDTDEMAHREVTNFVAFVPAKDCHRLNGGERAVSSFLS